MKTNIKVILPVLCLSLFLAAGMSAYGIKLLEQRSFTENDSTARESGDPNKAVFCDRVIDESQNPIQGAAVLIQKTYDEKSGNVVKVYTDRNGTFGIYDRPRDIRILSIFEKDYVFNGEKSAALFYHLPEDANDLSLRTPVCFHLQKSLGPEIIQDVYKLAFITKRPVEYRIDLKKEGGLKTITESGKASHESPVPKSDDSALKTGQKEQDDLLIRGEYLGEEDVYQLDMKVLNPGDGIAVSNTLLSIAPEAGYEAGLSMKLGMDNAVRHIYVAGPKNHYYSHLLVTAQKFPQSLIVRISCLTNKTGFGYFDFQPLVEENTGQNPVKEHGKQQKPVVKIKTSEDPNQGEK